MKTTAGQRFVLLLLLSAWQQLAIRPVSSLLSTVPTRQSQSSVIALSSTSRLWGVSKSQVAVLDGGEWASVRSFLRKEQGTKKTKTQHGYMKVVTGTHQGERVVGIQQEADSDDDKGMDLGNGVTLYSESVATIPKGISEAQAIATLTASLAGVHCTLPRVQGVGGGTDDAFVTGSVVVMGGGDYAKFSAEGLAALGATVTIVTTQSVKCKNPKVKVMPPDVGDEGFSDVIGTFDALLDTMYDERVVDEDEIIFGLGGGDLFDLLRTRHNCHRYVSAMTRAQRIVQGEGLIWGPSKADEHAKTLSQQIQQKGEPITSPRGFGKTLQTLLDNKVVFEPYKTKRGVDVAVRGWTLGEFWELTSWPRDASGGSSVRFGLPVMSDEFYMLEEAPEEDTVAQTAVVDKTMQEAPKENLPGVLSIVGLEGLKREILDPKRDCILFLSAPFCRTCKYLKPQYARLARQYAKNNDSDSSLVFANANATGEVGKELSRALFVDAVPAFVLYREGKLFGFPLSISKLPSKKLNMALELMESGSEWDTMAIQEAEQSK